MGCATILHYTIPTGTTKDRPTGRQADREKLKTSAKSLDFSTPPLNLKPFSASPRQREIPLLPKNSVYLIKNIYLCIMLLEIQNMIPYGLNLGFEIYPKDDEYDFHEVVISLLIIMLLNVLTIIKLKN